MHKSIGTANPKITICLAAVMHVFGMGCISCDLSMLLWFGVCDLHYLFVISCVLSHHSGATTLYCLYVAT